MSILVSDRFCRCVECVVKFITRCINKTNEWMNEWIGPICPGKKHNLLNVTWNNPRKSPQTTTLLWNNMVVIYKNVSVLNWRWAASGNVSGVRQRQRTIRYRSSTGLSGVEVVQGYQVARSKNADTDCYRALLLLFWRNYSHWNNVRYRNCQYTLL